MKTMNCTEDELRRIIFTLYHDGAITTDAFNDLRHCLYYAVEAGAFEDDEEQEEEQIPW